MCWPNFLIGQRHEKICLRGGGGGSDKMRFKPVCSATGTVILLVASLDMILFQSFNNKCADQTAQMRR